jgi:FMN phosphatase YigB (HAD superfamily)
VATIDAVIFDFDGTLTDADSCAAPFLEAFRARVAARARLGREAFHEAWTRIAAEIDAYPNQFGWEVDGLVVAPASADPYLRATCVARQLLADALPPEARDAMLDEDFSESYRLMRTVFRPEAVAIVDEVLASGRAACVVTNTRREWVRKRLATLPLRFGELDVYGEAAKWAVAASARAPERLASVPAVLELEGLARPVHLRRGRYLDALVAVEKALGVRLERTLVCGDVFELDLALPHALGAHVHLVTRSTTPDYELRAIEAMPRAGASPDLCGLRERLQLRRESAT